MNELNVKNKDEDQINSFIYMKRFINGIFSTGIGNLIVIINGFICIAIAARILEPIQLGIYILIETTAILFVTISELGLGISAAKILPEFQQESKIKSDHINTILTTRICIIITLVIIGCIGRIFLANIVKSDLIIYYAYWILLYFAFSGIEVQLSYILQGLHFYRRLSIARILSSVSRVLFVIIFLIILQKNLSGLLFASIIPIGLSSLYQFIGLPKWAKRICIRPTILLKHLSFGFPLWINSILTVLFYRFDIVVVGAISGSGGVAIYSIAMKIPESLMRLFQAFESVYLPHMSELLSKERRIEANLLMNQSIKMISYFSLLGTACAILFGKSLIILLFSDKYADAWPVFAILMLSICLEFNTNIMGYSLIACGKSDKPLKANLISIAINIISNLLLIPSFGIIAAAINRVFSRSISWPFYFQFIKKGMLILNMKYLIRLLILTIIFFVVNSIIGPESIILKCILISIYIVISILIINIKISSMQMIFGIIKKIRY